MEHLIGLVYHYTTDTIKKMSLKELLYFYEYFYYEYRFDKNHLTLSKKEKMKLVKILKSMKYEIINRNIQN